MLWQAFGRWGGISAGGGSGPPFVPTDLGSLVAWYDADQQTEPDGDPVNTFVDRTGNGFDMTQAGSGEPVLRYNNVNGKKAIEATAADQDMTASNTLLSGATAATMVMVVKGTADPSAGSLVDGAPVQYITGSGLPNHFFTDGNIYENFASSTRRSVDPPTSWASWRIYGVHSGANDWKMWWDGDAIITSGTNTVATGSDPRRLFARSDTAAGSFHGHLAELMFFDEVLSDSDRQKVEGYLAHKYDLAANLPGGHPYISSPP